MFGSVIVHGDYSVNAGWTVLSGGVYWVPQAGGVPQSTPIDYQNGKWGILHNGAIVPMKVTIQKGKYNIWASMIYSDGKMPPNKVGVLSSIYSVEIK